MKYLNIVMVTVATGVVLYTFSETFLRSGVSGAAPLQVEVLPVERVPARGSRPGLGPMERPSTPAPLPGTLGLGGTRSAGTGATGEAGETAERQEEGLVRRESTTPLGSGQDPTSSLPASGRQEGTLFTAPSTTRRPAVSAPRAAEPAPPPPATGPSPSLLPPPPAEVLQERSVRPPVDGPKREGDPQPPPIRSSMPNRRPSQ